MGNCLDFIGTKTLVEVVHPWNWCRGHPCRCMGKEVQLGVGITISREDNFVGAKIVDPYSSCIEQDTHTVIT